MTSIKLIIKEILYRKVNFLLSCCAVSGAITCVIGAFSLLAIHDLKTKELLNIKVEETETRVKELENDIRKITKKLGFNVLILPEEQNLDDFYSDSYASKFMPESYVEKLANSRIVTVRHLLPTLEQKVRWDERNRTVILVGIRGEVPMIHKNPKKPLVSAVEPGTVVLGYNIYNRLNIAKGDEITFMGEKFKVAKLHPERGNKDDITMWINLLPAQKLLHKKNLINGIMALECKCGGVSLEKIRKDILKILPGTKVISFAGKAQARRATRDRVEMEAKSAIEEIKSARTEVRDVMERLSSILIPFIIIIAAVWIAVLALTNTRERRYEIGLLRAIGVKSKTIFTIFILRAFFLSCVGVILGVLTGEIFGFIVGTQLNELVLNSDLYKAIFNLNLIVGIVICAPIFTIISSWIPAISASQLDPADILREE